MATTAKCKYDDITAITGVAKGTNGKMVKKAKEQGYDGGVMVDEHVGERPRPGRPRSVTREGEGKILNSVRKDRAGREKCTEDLAYDGGICR